MVGKEQPAGFVKLVPAILVLILATLFIICFLNGQFLLDTFSAIGYTPSDSMSTIKSSLSLTSDGDRIFNASKPVLDSQAAFNESCKTQDENATLGCYADRQIHVYDIAATELPGIRESTTAHELLHAVWARLSDSEKDRLAPYLNQVYDENRELLEADLKTYSAAEYLDELHSRVGTEIKDLPAELEEHYAKYFGNQDEIASFYDSYSTPFKNLKNQIETLGKELESLKSQIEAKTAEYESRATALNAAIAEFNNCASTTNCFTNRTTFNTRRAELVAEQTAVNGLYTEADNLIQDYNAKVAEYNNNVLKNQDLENLINSNSQVNNI